MMGYGMMGFGLVGLLFSLLVLVGIVVLVAWAVKSVSGGSRERLHEQTPREIVQARYARGEITREQYQEMLKELS